MMRVVTNWVGRLRALARGRADTVQGAAAGPNPQSAIENPRSAPAQSPQSPVAHRLPEVSRLPLQGPEAPRVATQGPEVSRLPLQVSRLPLQASRLPLRRWAAKWAAAALLATQAVLLAYGAAVHCPVINESSHLAAGISDWEFGRFGLFKVNPPLARMIAALPAMLVGAQTDWSGYAEGVGVRGEFNVGDDFARANGPWVLWLVTLARWALAPVVLLGGWICHRWARELYGEAAGLLALALCCFCPNILAYGQIITADAAATALGAAANYAFWRWLRQPSWGAALAAGVVLGLAELTKTTWIVLFGLWPAVWMVWELRVQGPRSKVERDGSKVQGPKPKARRRTSEVRSLISLNPESRIPNP